MRLDHSQVRAPLQSRSFHGDTPVIKLPTDRDLMVIMRGLPGSGKSTTVAAMQAVLPRRMSTAVASADDYFMLEGEYRFNPAMLPEAHNESFLGAQRFVSVGKCDCDPGVLFVDNTNISAWEISPYIALANAHKFAYCVLNIDTSLTECLARNAKRSGGKRVPEHTLANMAMRMREERLPPWWHQLSTKSLG